MASYQEVIDILRLIRSESIGPRKFFQFINFYGSPAKAINGLSDTPYKIIPEELSIKELESLEKFGAKYITFQDPLYPTLLKNIPDPPPFLSYLGNIELLSKEICAIIGSRNASFHGQNFAKLIAKELSSSNIVTASGLALGIDAAAHAFSLPKTIAVIAGGIDHIYPKQNTKLYNQISKEGLIISENPIHSTPRPQSFPKRNRIIAGISKVCLIVEAGLKSGSLTTARAGLKYNREICAVPGFPMDARSKGTNALIKQGAILVEDEDDILELFDKKNHSQILFEPANKVIVENNNETGIISFLSKDPISIDEIQKHSNLPLPTIHMILTDQELAGKVVRYPGNKYGLSYE